jgi:uncharacterized protein with FMN-binding domain
MKRKLKNGIALAALSIGSLVFGLRSASAAQQAVAGNLKDGEYTGKRVNTFYGYFRVQAVVSGGKLADVIVLEYPDDDHHSRDINKRVLPYLIEEAVAEQNYKVDFISGATLTCKAFQNSLQDALKAAGA